MDGSLFVGQNVQNAVDAAGGGVQAGAGLFQATAGSITGAAIATTTAPALYNPPNSGKLFRIMAVNLGDISGTLIRANLRYYWQANPILSGLTLGSVQSRSRYIASVAQFYTGLTVGTAASVFIASGLGSGGAIATQFYNLSDKTLGMYDVQPGELFYPFVSNAAWEIGRAHV